MHRDVKKTMNLVPETGIESATEEDQVELAEQEAITCGRRNHMGMTNIFQFPSPYMIDKSMIIY